MKREDTYSVRVSVSHNGETKDLGVWDKMDGGAVDSSSNPYRPGGLADQIDLGGTRTVSNVTVTKLYDDAVNDVAHWLYDRCGKASVVVTKQPTDPQGVAYGRPTIYQGTLKSSTPPSVDSNSSNAALFAIEVGTPTIS